jgi:phage-related protein (TIGR01555 family)
MISDGANDPSAPLDVERIGKAGIKFLTPLGKLDFSPFDREQDLGVEGFGMPNMWQVGNIKVHPSRLCVHYGIQPLAGLANKTAMPLDQSILNGMIGSLKRVEEMLSNVNSLVYEAKVNIIKIKGFSAKLAADRNDTYAAALIARFGAAATIKGISGDMLIDAEEEFEQKVMQFSGLDALIDKSMIKAASDAGMPMTVLFGISPAGMNATGEGDLRNYYDRVKHEQENVVTPSMLTLDEALIRSALGSRPDDIYYKWKPLWQPTEKERAETAGKIVDALDKVNKMDVLSYEAMAHTTVNAMVESGAFPGVEAAVDEFGYGEEPDAMDTDPDADPIDPDDPDAVPPKKTAAVKDMAPRTLYVRRDVTNAAEIIAWAKEQGFESTLPAADMHVTIAYSRAPIDWFKAGAAWEETLTVPAGGPRWLEEFNGGAKVLQIASSHLSWRHEEIKMAGASWDFPDFNPHITISYADMPEGAKPYTGRIELGPERFEEIDPDWKSRLAEA